MTDSPKIVEIESLEATVREVRAAGQRTVHCHGSFNILHPGHIRHLKWAKSQGHMLTVGVTADLPGEESQPFNVPAARAS